MTTLERPEEQIDAARHIREAINGRLPSAQLQAVSDHWMEMAAARAGTIRDRARAASRARREERSSPRWHGLKVVARSLGMAWAAVMLSTLAVAIVTRPKLRAESAALDPDANELRLRVALGPLAFTSHAPALRGGFVDCWYGGGFVDLREATLDPAGAVLRVRAIFGGGQIIVPETWRMTAHVRGIGGLHDGRPGVDRAADAPHLTIEGVAMFGGFTVQSDLSEKEKTELEATVVKSSSAKPRRSAAVPAG
jgi:hypothetical protein